MPQKNQMMDHKKATEKESKIKIVKLKLATVGEKPWSSG
jgi:hypothetical protein